MLLTSEPYFKFKIFFMKQIGLGEDNDDDVQETNGDQSRTISVPEAVVTQILPPATGKYTYSTLNNRNLMTIHVFQTFSAVCCTTVDGSAVVAPLPRAVIRGQEFPPAAISMTCSQFH